MFIEPTTGFNWSASGFHSYSLANDSVTSSNAHSGANVDLLEVDTSMTAVVSFPRKLQLIQPQFLYIPLIILRNRLQPSPLI